MRNKCSTFLFPDKDTKLSVVQINLNSCKSPDASSEIETDCNYLIRELTAANILLSCSIKHQGSVTLQITGNGPISLVVSECDNNGFYRSLIKKNSNYDDKIQNLSTFDELIGTNKTAIFSATIKFKDRKRNPYQGIVEINGAGLSESIECYLNKSEQIPSFLRLYSSGKWVKGFLLQALPTARDAEEKDSFNQMKLSLSSIKKNNFFENDIEDFFMKTHIEHNLIRTKTMTPRFRCTCTRKKLLESLSEILKKELGQKGQDSIEVKCEFCGKVYCFYKD